MARVHRPLLAVSAVLPALAADARELSPSLIERARSMTVIER